MLGVKPAQPVTGKIVCPSISTLNKMTVQELRKLRITTIEAFFPNIATLGLTYNDGTTCKAGTQCNYNRQFNVSGSKHICKIEIIMKRQESFIGQIIFYDNNGILFKLGEDFYATGRKEIFLIASDERLIGFEIDHGQNFVLGVTFLKWKVLDPIKEPSNF